MRRNRRWILCGLVILSLYLGGYATARCSQWLVFWSGYRGVHGVHGADLSGPQTWEALLGVAACEFILRPASRAETYVRTSVVGPPPRGTHARRAEPARAPTLAELQE